MKRTNRILLGVGCIFLLLVSWIVAFSAKSDREKQIEAIQQAEAYLKDEIYIKAVPLLEEATAYETDLTISAESTLKDVYMELIDQSGYRQKFEALLEKQMSRKDASHEPFEEAAKYYFNLRDEEAAFAALRRGIEKTNSDELIDYYEDTRYMFDENRAIYEDVTSPLNGGIAVKNDGMWGIAKSSGSLVIPCMYRKISSYDAGCAVASLDNEIIAVDQNNNRVAKFHGDAQEIGEFNNGVVSICTEEGWMFTTPELPKTSFIYQAVGTYSDGYVAAQFDDKWGLLNKQLEWVIEPIYQSIVMDELGRSYVQNVFFAEKSDGFYMMSLDGEVSGPYEAAKPFLDGWAAVKQNGKWGYINTAGEVKIPYQFEDADSFGQHLAGVSVNGKWGFISLTGEIVIEPKYMDVRNFHQGSAAVKIEEGWKFITLTEFKEGPGL